MLEQSEKTKKFIKRAKEVHGERYGYDNTKVETNNREKVKIRCFTHDINPKTKTTFGELYENTLKREKKLKKAGYKVISIWASDF